MDSSLFSHPPAEPAEHEALTSPQGDRYGSLFLEPTYPGMPEPSDEADIEPPRRPAHPRTRTDRPSGRRAGR